MIFLNGKEYLLSKPAITSIVDHYLIYHCVSCLVEMMLLRVGTVDLYADRIYFLNVKN